DFGDSRSARVLWLERTGFPGHLVGLKDEEIKSSSQLLRKSEGDEKADVDLVRIIHAAESVLRDAYALYSDTSPERKITQQQANILNEFYARASAEQKQALQEIVDALENKDEAPLKHAAYPTVAALPILGWEGGYCKALGTVVLRRTDCRVSRVGTADVLRVAAHSVRIPTSTHPFIRRANVQGKESDPNAVMEESAELRAMFLTEADDRSMVLSIKAIAIYKATAQEFLKRLLVLKHILPSPPIQEPELLSVTWRNTAQQRHLFLGLQGQHPVLAKGDWGSAVGLHCICNTSTLDVSPLADTEGLNLSMPKESVCSGQGATISYVELETSISFHLQGEVLCKGSG
ncbi:hypothetical protein V498_07970, partial [Pseudogymnoascus sp. VKM F-4517 (FW-2822)]